MTSVHNNKTFTQDSLVQNGTNNSYGIKPDATHIWVPAEGNKQGSGKESSKINRNFSTGTTVGKGSTITIHDINYTVKVKTKACCGKTTDKAILKGIDGKFQPGMNAILGPTGSGKSSLLDVLAGRKDPTGLTGTLLLDGCPPPDNFKCMVGYVVQDDVVMGTLSVKENFHFSAALRLPPTVSAEEREERVQNVIAELGLQHCANTKVGNEFIRGVSGGERKRCNIGMELIISPPVLFLDEPTTGLDANTANTVMLLLKTLAMRGRTIIFSIHQPRYSIYRLFDNLCLLSMGEVVYHGNCDESLQFFQTIGYSCEEHNNPPDFFLDVINGDPNAVTSDINQIISSTDMEKVSLGGEAGSKGLAVHEKLVSAYQNSQWKRKLTSDLSPILQEHQSRKNRDALERLPPIQYATNGLTQFLYCSQRTLRNLIRNPAVSVLQVLTMVIFAVVVGAIYWQIDDSCKSGLQNRTGAFFFIIMNMVFGNLSAVELFIKNRAIFLHENVSGFYRISAYFLSTVLCDVIPMRFLPTLAFSAVVYYMLGFLTAFDKFLVFFLGLFLVSLAASAVSFCISACVKIFAVANLLIAMCYVVMMVFSGLLVNLDSIPDFLEWLKYFSIFRYSLTALSINELKDMTFVNSTATENCITGNEYLDAQGIKYETDWDLWVNYMALGVMSVGFLVLAYIRLLFMNKLR
ncbi:broad substrate specificity ATP-binding cassette transporter ABCG2-like isoform X2 [Ruditapes philippinarum]|uniref:broad substrate specificity ATP-binding cassette transporter ABCG2-like isoform X2 n=1 Tax=Ruditapes philippinarum TaxID=129788 RepID=UPI00295B50DC|nr:broad substrate specificity ATP-binding cassette transporter ABCG2-like isoform X2 [Ruditapes philippinarum]